MNSTGEVEDSDVIVVGIAFILSRARHICMLCDNWPVIWTEALKRSHWVVMFCKTQTGRSKGIGDSEPLHGFGDC